MNAYLFETVILVGVIIDLQVKHLDRLHAEVPQLLLQ